MTDMSRYSDEELIDILSSDTANEMKKRGYEYGWYKKEQYIGAVYILVNPAFPNLVKIGYADDVQKRLKTLNSNSGLPDPFHCYAVYNVKKRLEDLKLHSLIDTLDPALRHSKNREFYEMNGQKAYEILSAIAQINGNEEQLTINPFNDDFFIATPPNPNTSSDKKKDLTFSMLEIPIGSVLIFKKDKRISCITKDNVNKVEYKGVTYSISGLAKKLLNVKAAQGGLHFMYNDEVLTDRRKRLGV